VSDNAVLDLNETRRSGSDATDRLVVVQIHLPLCFVAKYFVSENAVLDLNERANERSE